MKLVHTPDVPWAQVIDHGNFGGRRKALAGNRLTCGMWELPPGKKSFPMHLHHVTEEAMYVLSGHAKVRTPEGESAIAPGDFISFPPGGPAHQLINDGSEPLIYLAMSATQGHDIVQYPDSGKLACSVGSPPGGKRFVFKESNQADYWEGEE